MTGMGIDPIVLRDQCTRTLGRTDFHELGTRIEGKVRDCYVAAGRRSTAPTGSPSTTMIRLSPSRTSGT